jgi:hypothetical protein
VSNDTLSLIEASEIAMCGPQKFAQGLRAGLYPGVKVGRAWVIPRAALLERLNELARAEAERRRNPRPVVVGSRRRPLVTIPAGEL